MVLGAAAAVGVTACSAAKSRTALTQPSTTLPVVSSTATAATDQSGTSDASGYFPPASGSWETTTAAAAGFSDAGLADVVQLVGDSHSTSFMIVHGGRIVAEQYWAGATAESTNDLASAQKSVVSTLVGLARDRALLALDDVVADYLEPGWTAATPAQERAITIRHLLTMTSGLDERTLTATASPGTKWEYNTAAYQKLRRVLEAAADTDINSLIGTWLFDTIGIDNPTAWTPRPARTADAVGDVAWGLNLRAREMARFGLFAQRNGNWAGQQVTDPGWFAEAWTSVPQRRDYGYLWWLLGKGRLGGRGAPADLVAALGAKDQKIYVVPSLDLVVTRQGDAANDVTLAISDFDERLIVALGNARA